jgi:predicted Zn finger-like uncharacterized protein
MRLICPNCAAQYEVDDSVIPEAGRDVQCSNCGHTWWQRRVEEAVGAEPAAEALAPGAEAEGAHAEARWPEEDTLPGPAPGQEMPAWPEAPDEHAAEAAGAQPTWPEAPPETVTAPAPQPPIPPQPHLHAPQRTLDEAVLDVLRQEAERESKARKTEGGAAVETQPDLGLGQAAGDARIEEAARERVEMMQGLEAGEAEDESGRPERRIRRSKLPDVEEINSTLAGQQMAEAAAGRAVPAAAGGRRSGFRAGFTLMILIAIAIGAIYSYADRIVAAAPGTAPAMKVFVTTIDSVRVWLDKAALTATEAITSLSDGE